MAKECCANCRYCEYSPRGDKHIGKNGSYDWYCWYHRKWLGEANGKCRDYEEK
ncbi:MAG: hypothetical protein IJ489_10095 [Clostridia bacterium]|nr:hypothetical protein [Clostridia bacterium]